VRPTENTRSRFRQARFRVYGVRDSTPCQRGEEGRPYNTNAQYIFVATIAPSSGGWSGLGGDIMLALCVRVQLVFNEIVAGERKNRDWKIIYIYTKKNYTTV
jgi:hypothetical protein